MVIRMATPLIDRRAFMRACGAGFATALAAGPAFALARTDAVYATACRLADGRFAIATLTEDGTIVDRQPLPARAHGLTVSARTGLTVFFARRPGTFAMAYDPAGRREPVTFSCPENRHFYGHGTFSPDGTVLYATENDYDGARGIVGVYDATDGFARIDEFPSHGVGPHDMATIHGGKTLIVANGGIETHPDYGRTKLNLAAMEPSLVFIDRASGALIEKHALPAALSQVSTRHVAEDARGVVWFGCQYEGAKTDRPPLVGRVAPGEALHFCDAGLPAMRRLSNYVGAVAINRERDCLAVTSPVGGAALLIDLQSEAVIETIDLREVCGVAPARDGAVMSTYSGTIAGRHHDGIAWDQHIADLKPSRS